MLCSADAMYMRIECKFVQSCVSTCGVFKLHTNVLVISFTEIVFIFSLSSVR